MPSSGILHRFRNVGMELPLYAVRNIAQEGRYHLHRGGSLKSRKFTAVEAPYEAPSSVCASLHGTTRTKLLLHHQC